MRLAKKLGFALLALILLTGKKAWGDERVEFYSSRGKELAASLRQNMDTNFRSLEELSTLGARDRSRFVQQEARPLMKFLFGPLVRRKLGSPQSDDLITVKWNEAFLRAGKVAVPVEYKASWIVDDRVQGGLILPVPRSKAALFTAEWKKCTDSAPEHATDSFYWYFWDPARPGCDHKPGREYDEVQVKMGTPTPETLDTYPEYNRMIRGGELRMTIAFGYTEDATDPHPEKDADPGAAEYRSFLFAMGRDHADFAAKPLRLSEFRGGFLSDRVIGYTFTKPSRGTRLVINVVIAAGIDQMDIFARSFAHDHDAVFAWMGHSRVGSGFDAENFRNMVREQPDYYSVTSDYQLVYWGGCNSYSYYTLPFFEIKAEADREDPRGTRNLDIIAHGMPSYFSIGAENSSALVEAVLSPQPLSFQKIIARIERNGVMAGTVLLAVAMGDEDNPR